MVRDFDLHLYRMLFYNMASDLVHHLARNWIQHLARNFNWSTVRD